jgi:hypothetical protein
VRQSPWSGIGLSMRRPGAFFFGDGFFLSGIYDGLSAED